MQRTHLPGPCVAALLLSSFSASSALGQTSIADEVIYHGPSAGFYYGKSVAWSHSDLQLFATGTGEPIAGGPAKVILESRLGPGLATEIANPGSQGARFGASLAFAGDSQPAGGDGEAELLVGTPRATNAAGDETGAVYVYEVGATVPIATLWGVTDGDQFGAEVANIGDVDGDRVDDFAVGAPEAVDANGLRRGSVTVYSGSSLAVLATLTGAVGSGFGFSIAGTGDIDGDLVDDFIVGAPEHKVEFNPALGPLPSGAIDVISGANLQSMLLIRALKVTERLGFDVAPAGDINKDGHADFIAGAPYGMAFNGSAYVFSGANGQALASWVGGSPNDQLGYQVAGGAEFNGDGTPDIAYSIPNESVAGQAGTVRVHSGLDFSELASLGGEVVGGMPTDFGLTLEFATESAAGLNPLTGVEEQGLGDLIIGAPAYGRPDDLDPPGRVYIVSEPAADPDGATLIGERIPTLGAGFVELTVSSPVLPNSTATVSITGAPANSTVYLAIDSSLKSVRFGSGRAKVDFTTSAVVALNTDGSGAASWTTPTPPQGVGQVVLQLFAPSAAVPGQVGTSNAAFLYF